MRRRRFFLYAPTTSSSALEVLAVTLVTPARDETLAALEVIEAVILRSLRSLRSLLVLMGMFIKSAGPTTTTVHMWTIGYAGPSHDNI